MSRVRQTITTLKGVKSVQPSYVQPEIKRAVITAFGPNPNESEIATTPRVQYKIIFPFGPNDMQFQQHNGVYSRIDRPFKKPLNIFSGGSLRVVTFEAIIANRDNGGLSPSLSGESGETVQDILDNLETISQTGATCDFMYGVTRLPYQCFLTDFSYTIMRRNPDGQPVLASTSIQLTEKVSYNPDTRILPMIVRPPSGSSPTYGGNKTNNNDADNNTELVLVDFSGSAKPGGDKAKEDFINNLNV